MKCLEIKQVGRIWPEGVECEMNLDVWRKELRDADILETHGFLLEGFKYGFDQGIPEVPIHGKRYFCPENHVSVLAAAKEVRENLAGEIKAGRMFGPFH